MITMNKMTKAIKQALSRHYGYNREQLNQFEQRCKHTSSEMQVFWGLWITQPIRAEHHFNVLHGELVGVEIQPLEIIKPTVVKKPNSLFESNQLEF